MPVEVELDTETIRQRRDVLLEKRSRRRSATGRSVGDEMSADPLVVAPEDTLGEVAEQMCERKVDSPSSRSTAGSSASSRRAT